MIQYMLLKRYPSFLRWYRTQLMLDWNTLLSLIPSQGKLLDVGCGVGLVAYKIAIQRPAVEVLGIDIAGESIALAKYHHKLPNLQFSYSQIETVDGVYDCILFIDVFHHVPPSSRSSILHTCRSLLSSNGYILVKDIERRRGQVNWFLDTCITGCSRIYLNDCNELTQEISKYLTVVKSRVQYRFPFPHFYIKATSPLCLSHATSGKVNSCR